MKIIVADTRTLPLREDEARVMECLPEAERRKALAFVRAEDRLRSCVGSLLVRRGIRAALQEKGADPAFRLSRNEYGKPFVDGHEEIGFSLSHSGCMVVFASWDRPVGVDVEEITDLDLSLFGRFLSSRETRMIAAAADPLQTFFRIWTVREAFAKQTGQGLSVFEREAPEIDYTGERILFRGNTLMIRTFVSAGHVISLCAESIPSGLAPHLITPAEWRDLLQGAGDFREEGERLS